MGGLDIFKAEKATDGKFTKAPENLKSPMNSAGDDFGIIFEGKKIKGYFTSNREGGKGSDDIYSFILPPLNNGSERPMPAL
jgi:peptidoglycan-associated lipoprotein